MSGLYREVYTNSFESRARSPNQEYGLRHRAACQCVQNEISARPFAGAHLERDILETDLTLLRTWQLEELSVLQ